ncbi:MAG: hypothetical protein L0Z53_27615 [Acidobacteriales bacterium]|nr:hypothetical protein [Terriglobales bacterium]
MTTQALNQKADLLFSFYARTDEERDAQRITAQQIAALKRAHVKADNAAVATTAMIGKMFREIAAAVQNGFNKPVKRHPMCEFYGHVADLATWTEHLPKCCDCGAQITSRHELRTSKPIK